MRILISAGLLWFVLRNVEYSALAANLELVARRWPIVIAALLLPALGLVVAAVRWQFLLAGYGDRPPVRTLISAQLVGGFFNLFFPSTLGGDVARSWWVARPLGSSVASLTVVGLDRAIGVVGICFVAAVAAVLYPGPGLPSAGAFWTVEGVVIVGTIVLIAIGPAVLARVGTWIGSRSGLRRLERPIRLMHQAWVLSRRDTRRLFGALLMSVTLQLLIVLQYSMLAIALDVPVSPLALGVVIPVVTLITLVPVSINGIGLRETALAVLGAPFGVGAADAVAMAWIVLTGTVMYAVIGGLVYARGRRPTGGNGEAATTKTKSVDPQAYWDDHAIGAEPFEQPIRSEEFYHRYIDYYDHFYDYKGRVFQYERYRGRRVLDVGCGSGIDSLKFARHGADLTCLDVSETSIRCTQGLLARFGLTAQIERGDVQQLAFGDCSLDVVYAYGVLMHVEDDRRAIAEIHRVLKPGGEALVVLYHRRSWYWLLAKLGRVNIESEDGDPPYKRVYTVRQAREMFAAFDNVELSLERFPRRTRRRIGLMARVFNDLFVPAVRLIPHWIMRHFGWHIVVKATK